MESAKQEYLEKLEQKAFLQKNLPHLYGWKFYKWARAFFESTNTHNFLCAANQISKSSTQIRKCIDWATNIPKWEKLWPTTPKQFWYLYPDYGTATAEFDEKWVKEFLPRGPLKDHPIYGWEAFHVQRNINKLVFNSGVSVYFKTYEQKPRALQASSVYAMFCDEELPVGIYDELMIRMASPSVNGYFHMAFTATIGQEFWYDTMEVKGPKERFKDALKLQVSMYDCLEYEDGSPGPWTIKKIKQIEASCKSEAEVQRRVYGRFVVSDDLQYPGFDAKRNYIPRHPVPSNWVIYAGIDPGTGGNAHPAAIVFVAVKPDMSEGRVIKCWRGDGIQTTSSELVSQYLIERGNMNPAMQIYDWASKDFAIVAGRMGHPFVPANKEREFGQRLLNNLFKTGMLKIYEGDQEGKLVWELKNLRERADKSSSKDDLIDALRYVVTMVPWDYSKMVVVESDEKPDPAPQNQHPDRKRFYANGFAEPQDEDGLDLLQSEFDEANEMMDYFSDGEHL